MKKLMVTAAALMFGTSAFAWAPAEKAHMDAMGGDIAKSEWSAGTDPLAFSSFDDKGALKAESAGIATASNWTDTDAAEAAVPKAFAKWEDPTVEAAEAVDMGDVKGAVQTAAVQVKEQSDSTAIAAAAGKETGMGGPVGEAQGYPPCDPGPGDDRCIQLYERGVSHSLAAWKGSDSDVAMGGPYQPVADGAKDQSADHSAMDHSTAMPADTADKPEATTETDSTVATDKPMDTTASTSPGVGGPSEARDDYPPCSRTVTDRCIQLNERGVSAGGK